MRSFHPSLMDDESLAKFAKLLADAERYDWKAKARPEQVMPKRSKDWPEGVLRLWVIMAGRGWGKSRSGAEAVRDWCQAPNTKVAVVARTYRDLRLINFEGRASGLINIIPPEDVAEYNRGVPYIVLKNGSTIIGYSSVDPDIVRGQEFDAIWGDEYAAWHANTAQDMFEQCRQTLRESPDPRFVLTTTPKRVPHVVKLARQWEQRKSGLVVTRGHTLDNKANLNRSFVEDLEQEIGGTRLGRQEMGGELLEDAENALWTYEMIHGALYDGLPDEDGNEDPDLFPAFRRVIVAVDPSGSKDGDATGIVVVAYDTPGSIYVLDDCTTNGTPESRYLAAVRAAEKWGASLIVAEGNYGGDNVLLGLRAAWKEFKRSGGTDREAPTMELATAKGDKALRAEPVAAMYERQAVDRNAPRIFHAGGHTNRLKHLENELLSWEPNGRYEQSPNRLDALVHGVRQCLRELGREATFGRPPKRVRIGGDGWRP